MNSAVRVVFLTIYLILSLQPGENSLCADAGIAEERPTIQTRQKIVFIDSVPRAAAVFDNTYSQDKSTGYLGTTPLTLMMPADCSHNLYFTYPGFITARSQVELGQRQICVTLQPASIIAFLTFNFRDRSVIAWSITGILVFLVITAAALIIWRWQLFQFQLSEPGLNNPEYTGLMIGDYRVLKKLGVGTPGRHYDE